MALDDDEERDLRSVALQNAAVIRLERQRAEEEIHRANEALEAKTLELANALAMLSDADRRKNEFLAMLAHELRNPLAPIQNALHVIRMTKGSPQPVEVASAIMERQISQMVRLVDDLLDVGRISLGKVQLRRERMDLAAAVEHALEAARPLCDGMSHTLTVSLPATPMFIDGDRTRLTQVVGNLLNNACKFMENGGRVSLSLVAENGAAVIRVRDTGIGIAAEQLPRIFDMFSQADTSLERPMGGLGIGLTVVKSLVEMHDGAVAVRSAGLGQGTEFVVRLPLVADQEMKTGAVPAVETLPTVSALRILVVDDNHDSAESLAMLLALDGNETRIAYDGIEAVDAAASFRPDLVLCDIGLPGVNGYEACRRIRREPWGKDLVMIAVTGLGQKEDREEAKAAGFSGHLVKPVAPTALARLLTSLRPARDPR